MNRAEKETARLYWTGKRIQMPAYCDAWMMGDRYGEVIGTRSSDMLRVKLDRSGRIALVKTEDAIEV